MSEAYALSLPMVAKRFGVSRTRVFSAVKSGALPAFRIGSMYRVRLENISPALIEKWTRLPAELPSGDVVYFIGGDDGPIKIGRTSNLAARLRRLNTSSATRLAVLATCEGSAEIEASYHASFAAHRAHGEWFERHPDILAEIERLNLAAY